jgi:hypothetical protein
MIMKFLPGGLEVEYTPLRICSNRLINRRFKMRMYSTLFLAYVCAAGSVSALAEDCPIPKNINFLPVTDAPLNGAPRKDKPDDPRPPDCAFYQWAWQTFLYATDLERGHQRRRLLEYSTFADVFKVKHSPLFADARPGLLSLGPRTIEHSNTELARAGTIDDFEQAQSNAVLIDLEGGPIWYQIHLNPTFRDFVVANRLDDKDSLKTAPANLVFRSGSVEFKSAWQIVEKNNSEYITADAVVPIFKKDPKTGEISRDGNKTKQVKVALLALHVVGVIDGHPEFIWATFEHTSQKKNSDGFRIRDLAPSALSEPKEGVPNQKIADLGIAYHLFKGPSGDLPPPQGVKLSGLKLDDKQRFSPVSNVFRVFPVSKAHPDPSDMGKEDGAVLSINRHIQEAFESRAKQGHADVRSNYSLVGAVWLNDPSADFKPDQDFGDNAPSKGFGGEDALSSMAMESFTQTSFPNCFSCHDTQKINGLPVSALNVSHALSKFFSMSK